MIYVEHINNKENFPNWEYVGREWFGLKESILANPFKIGKDISRSESIKRYKKHIFKLIIDKDINVLNEFIRLYEKSCNGDLYLLCWCYPKKCHAEVIRDVLMFGGIDQLGRVTCFKSKAV